ncbi:MAG: endonuclease/exonuclease/phosphatase family protein [Prevotellaceae bacterium]|jgi:endonuclease/exonuclease/phosphatase family metal-dependent hydrolase|nr:endonuclease/exonuclease/phosphatase family protein [Prevotellaceae bacterium]
MWSKIPKSISIASVASLFLSFLSGYVSPAKIWLLAYFGLLFQLFFLANIIMLIFWIISRKKRFIILHIIVLIPNIFFSDYFVKPFGSEKDVDANSVNIKLLSYNLQGFRIPYQKNTTQKKIADFINNENPDIICLQEFYTNDNVTEQLFASLLSEYKYHTVFYSVKRKNSSYGIATFSRYPIKMELEIPFENTANAAMYTDIDVNGKIIRIYNVHLQSIKLNINNLFSGKHNRIEEIEEASSRLKTAFIKRAGQVDIMAKHIKVSPYPAIICGDFNDTPMSYTYNKLKGNRLDSFCEAGKGMPSTYRLSVVPFFRIDYILHDKTIKSLNYAVHKIDYSDHYPISSVVNISGN